MERKNKKPAFSERAKPAAGNALLNGDDVEVALPCETRGKPAAGYPLFKQDPTSPLGHTPSGVPQGCIKLQV